VTGNCAAIVAPMIYTADATQLLQALQLLHLLLLLEWQQK